MDPPCSTRVSRARVYSRAPQSQVQGFHLLRRCIQHLPLRDCFIRFRSPLLTESLLLSFPVVTEMFHFSTFAPSSYAFGTRYPCGWVAPFGNPRIAALLPAPLGLSQVYASFIASQCQDIHCAPLLLDHTNLTPRSTLACRPRLQID